MDSHKNHSTEATNGEIELGEHNGNATAPSVQQEAAETRKHWTDVFRCWTKKPTSASATPRQRLHVRLVEWLKHPAHVALLAWSVCVAASVAVLVLLLLGALDGAIPRTSTRNRWIEIDSQVINALFTLMSIYQHPSLLHHSVLLCRWRPEDAKELRRVYCKNGACRPNERFHMAVVLLLLHITLLSQYVMCGLYWGYSGKTRPEDVETSFAVLGTVAPVLAALYTNYSPLGRQCEAPPDEASNAGSVQRPDEVTVDVNAPEWAGGVFDCGDDAPVCCMSFFCTFCVFGWNASRLGLGNAYVHGVMFALLCFAPLWVFNVAALNIRDEAVGDMVGAAGVALCAFGLLYGGFWRMRMRKKYRLPGSSLKDYCLWMFCWACSLAQEVRTGNLFDADDTGVHRESLGAQAQGRALVLLLPLPGETSLESASHSGSCSAVSEAQLLLLQEQICLSPAGPMSPPIPTSMQPEDRAG